MRESIAARTGPALRLLWTTTFLVAAVWSGRASAEVQPGEIPQGQAAGPALEQPPQSTAAPQPLAAEAPRRSEERGIFGLQLNMGPFSGFGGGVVVGPPAVGLRAAFGWTPLLMVLDTGGSTDLKFYSGWQVSPDVYVRLVRAGSRVHMGLEGGYRYNSNLGHGAALAWYADFALGRVVGLNATLGFLVFPDGEDHLKREEHLPSSTDFSFPGPSFNFGASFGVVFFP